MSYYDNWSRIHLHTRKERLEDELKILGKLYNHNFSETPSNMEKVFILYDDEGYDFSEQIYDHYSELGAILEALGNG